jgi:hypothetical protein
MNVRKRSPSHHHGSQIKQCATLNLGFVKPYFGSCLFQSDFPLCHSRFVSMLRCYNFDMTKQLAEAIKTVSELPDDEQDMIAEQLIRLMRLASLEEE